MNIKKTITKAGEKKLFLSELLHLDKSLCDFLLAKYGEVECRNFEVHIYLDDEEITLENISEFDSVFPNITGKINGFIVSLDYKKIGEYGDLIQCRFVSVSIMQENIDVELGSKITELPEKIFQLLFEKLKDYRVVKYDPESEERRKYKDAVVHVSNLLTDLNKLQLRMTAPIKNEKELQSFLFPVLKSHYPDLEEEFYLPQFADTSYKPDFGIPYQKILIECKFWGNKSKIKKIQKEIIDDSVGYLQTASYRGLIVLIYNETNAPVSEKFKNDLEKIKGVEKIIVIPAVNPNKRYEKT